MSRNRRRSSSRRLPGRRARIGTAVLAGAGVLGLLAVRMFGQRRGAVGELHDAALIELPLRGESGVPNSPGHDRFAFDFVAVRDGRSHSRNWWNHLLGQLSVEDVYGWGQPVHAPLDGEVIAIGEGWPDRTRLHLLPDVARLLLPGPVRDDLRPAVGNHILVRSGSVTALLAHLRQGSLRVAEGDSVRAGDVIAEVGNSGRSLVPHLHIQLMDGPDPRTARIVPFKVRQFQRWEGGAWRDVENGVLKKGQRIRA